MSVEVVALLGVAVVAWVLGKAAGLLRIGAVAALLLAVVVAVL